MIGTCMLVSEVWKQICLTFVLSGGAYQWWYFPFQLCSLPMYLCFPLAFLKEGRARSGLLAFLADFSLLSGAAAFLDTSGMQYGYLPLTVHSYAWHVLLILTGLYAGSRRRDFGPASFRDAVFVYLGGCAAAEVINLAFDRYGVINMFYINPHYYMGQIGFHSLLGFLPNPAVIAAYILATVLGAGLLHLIWRGWSGSRRS